MFVLGGAVRNAPAFAPPARNGSASAKSRKAEQQQPRRAASSVPIGMATSHTRTKPTPTVSPASTKHSSSSSRAQIVAAPARSSKQQQPEWIAPPPAYQKHAPSVLSCICHGGVRIVCEDCVAQETYRIGYLKGLEEAAKRQQQRARLSKPSLSRTSTLESVREEEEF